MSGGLKKTGVTVEQGLFFVFAGRGGCQRQCASHLQWPRHGQYQRHLQWPRHGQYQRHLRQLSIGTRDMRRVLVWAGSEQAADGTVVVYVNVFGGGAARQAGHRIYLAGQRHDKTRARR